MNILLVEDDHLLAKDIVNQVKELGYVNIKWTSRVKEAKTLFKQILPEIAIIDVHLDHDSIDGIELAIQFRQSAPVSLIYLTGYRDEATSARAQICKPSSTLIKPVHIGQLHTAIELAARDWNQAAIAESGVSTSGAKPVELKPVFVKYKKKYIRVDWDSILWVEAYGSSVVIQMPNERICIGKNLKSFIHDSPVKNLIRVHRSYAVNMQHVQFFDDQHLFVTLDEVKKEIPYSKTYKSQLHTRLKRILTKE